MPEVEIPLDDMELLAGDEEEVEVPDNSESEEEVESEESDENGLEVEAEEESEEQEEPEEDLDLPFKRPGIKDINTKFPGFFKEFPEMKDAIFREREFTGIFPTIEDAKEALTDNQAYDTLSDAVLSGDPTPLLDSVESSDKKAFEAFSLSFLPALYKKSPDVYNDVVTPVFENIFRHAYRNSDDALKESVIKISQLFFGDDAEAIVTGKKTFNKYNLIQKEQEKLKTEKQTNDSSAFITAARDVEAKNLKQCKAIILKDFDPNKVFSPIVRDALANEVIKRLNSQLVNDKGHLTVMQARWKHASKKGYSEDEKAKITSTFLARAKSLIPSIREKVRAEALGKSVKANDKKLSQMTVHKEKITPGKVASGNSTRTVSKQEYRKMSDDEILAL